MSVFKLKHFSLNNDRSALKIGTDSILLGSIVPIPDNCTRIYDIGTGTGIVAMMLAQRSAAQVVGIEIDHPSFEEAAGNFAAGPWAERMWAVEGDFKAMSFEEAATGQVSSGLEATLPVDSGTLVVSNPPYYEEDTISPLAVKARAKSTAAGLSYRDIFEKFAALDPIFKPQIALILPFSCKTQLFWNARRLGFFPCKCINIRTLAHKPFTRIVATFSPSRDVTLEETDLTLFISGSEKTPEYAEFTKDFQ